MTVSLAVLIVNYCTPDLALESARSASLSAHNFNDLSVLIVDGQSPDNSASKIAEALRQKPDRNISLLPLAVNGGFAYANNRGMMHLSGQGLPQYIALINPDARVRPGALETMVALLEREPKAGAVGAMLEGEDGKPQSSAFNFPSLRGEFARGARTGVLEKILRTPPISISPPHAAKVPWVAGTAVIFRTEALRDSGLFDEGFFLYFEETELMYRLRKSGWDIWHEPSARVMHLGGVATKIRDPETGRPRRGKPMPRYWYESRRRYFGLVSGKNGVMASALAWMAGRVIWLLRCAIARKADDGPLHMTRDFARYAFFPRASDTQAAVQNFDSSPEALPAWQRDNFQ